MPWRLCAERAAAGRQAQVAGSSSAAAQHGRGTCYLWPRASNFARSGREVPHLFVVDLEVMVNGRTVCI